MKKKTGNLNPCGTYRIRTIGCKVNQFDSSAIEGALRHEGLQPADASEPADVCVINTCTVTGKSDYQSRQLIRRMIRENPDSRVVVTGCYAEVSPEEVNQIEGVALVLRKSDKKNITFSIKQFISTDCNNVDNTCSTDAMIGERPTPLPYETSRARAFLRIQQGCDSRCTYCIVWKARGPSRSMPVHQVLEAAREIEERGFLEIVLTGIHIGYYGRDLPGNHSLEGLIRDLLRSTSKIRFRISSIEPNEVTPGILSLLAGEERICRHLHIPLQAGSDEVLSRMGRRYRTADYRETVEKAKSEIPGVCIGADLIAGFPGESSGQFEDAHRFIEDLPLNYLHVFPYSKRKGTPAADMADQVAGPEKKVRAARLRTLSGIHMERFYRESVGTVVQVIVESIKDNGRYYKCISDNYLKLYIPRKMVNSSGIRTVHVRPDFIRAVEETKDKERGIPAQILGNT